MGFMSREVGDFLQGFVQVLQGAYGQGPRASGQRQGSQGDREWLYLARSVSRTGLDSPDSLKSAR